MTCLLAFPFLLSIIYAFDYNSYNSYEDSCQHFIFANYDGKSYAYSTPALKMNYHTAEQTCSRCFGMELADIDYQLLISGVVPLGNFWISKSQVLEYSSDQITLKSHENAHRRHQVLCGSGSSASSKCIGSSCFGKMQRREYFETPTAATPSTCNQFSLVTINSKSYWVSDPSLKLSFSNGANLCNTCFQKSLADITNAVAIVGSPSHEQFYVGSYDGGDFTCNLIFINHTLAVNLDGSVPSRFMCDTSRAGFTSPCDQKKRHAFDYVPYPTMAPPTAMPTRMPTPPPTHSPTALPTTAPTTAPSICQSFGLTFIANKAYQVSNANLKLSFANAASLCQTCFHTALADISNAGAIAGSPNNANFYVGSYDGGDFTCNLVFVNHTLAAFLDGTVPQRFICDTTRLPESPCSGFPTAKRALLQAAPTPTSAPTRMTSCSFFSTVSIPNGAGSRSYFVSNENLKLPFTNAASVCSSCFRTNLADIPSGVAVSGSPVHDTYYVGSFDGGAFTCNLVFVNNTLAAILNGSIPLRFMCDSSRAAESVCNGFPTAEPSPPTSAPTTSPSMCAFEPIVIAGKSYLISASGNTGTYDEATSRCAACNNRRLADVPNAVALAGSPNNENLWIGSYDGGDIVCNLAWRATTVTVAANPAQKLRFLCEPNAPPSNVPCLS